MRFNPEYFAHLEGRVAHQSGRGRNPYSDSSPVLRDAWLAGWLASRGQDDARAAARKLIRRKGGQKW